MASVSSGDEQQSELNLPDQNLRVFVCNTFLHVKDADAEAQKAQQMKRSFSDSSLGSKSPSDNDTRLPRFGQSSPPPIFNTAALGSNQLQFPNGSSQLQLPNGPRSHSGDECPQHMVWNDLSSPWRSCCSSDSSLDRDRGLGPRAQSPNIVRQYHSDGGQTADGDDKLVDEDGYPTVPGPDRSTWSEGAVGHEDGNCKPCAWNWKAMGCSNAATCQFCHMCPKDTLKENRKAVMLKLKKLKKAAAAANAPTGPAALQPGQVSAGTSAAVSAGAVPKVDQHNGVLLQ